MLYSEWILHWILFILSMSILNVMYARDLRKGEMLRSSADTRLIIGITIVIIGWLAYGLGRWIG